MCGIAGYLGRSQLAGVSFVKRANDLLRHRGPDGEGIFSDGDVALGHRRLSIVDLSAAGSQPMTSKDGRFTLVYNGEVYNHESLRPALAKRWDFKSRSDTETILAALALDGPPALETMVGMWALALWDGVEKKLLLSRDRYGQKPLHWRWGADGSFQFASEIAPLLELGERPKIHAPAAAEFIAIGNYGHLGERTFFEDIYSFKPGHWTLMGAGDKSFSQQRYWRFPARGGRDFRPYDDAAKRSFRAAFEEAASSQMMSDVPLAATLSGGLDSTAVVGAMVASNASSAVSAFTAQAKGSKYDESRYVEAVGAKWGAKLRIESIPVERMPLSLLTREVITAQEEPFGDPSIIAHYLITRSVRKAGISVLLGGQGGDELLLAYTYMAPAVIASQLRAGRVGYGLRELGNLETNMRTRLRIALAAVSPRLEEAARARSRRGEYRLLTPALRAASIAQAPRFSPISNLPGFWLDSIERLALPHLMHYDDRNGMRNSVEGRMPFLDHRLADVVTGIDPASFFNGGQRKLLLREACADLMPDEVRNRNDKIGFHTPLTSLLRQESAWVRESLCGERALALCLYEPAIMGRCCDDLENGSISPGDAGFVWRALAMAIWADVFNADCAFSA